jgi:hypothetical protein
MWTERVLEKRVIVNQLTGLVAVNASDVCCLLTFAHDRPIGIFLEDRELDNPKFTKFYCTLYDNCQAWLLRNVTPACIQSLIFCLTI